MTKNFNKSEFDCSDGEEMPINVYHNMLKVAKQLQVLRDFLNKPVHINSAYRTEDYNKQIGGAHKLDEKTGLRIETSQHVFGRAADITVKGVAAIDVYITLQVLIETGQILEGGLGLYEEKNFVHYDIRGLKVRWNG
tara:strand:+ start:671 stop:1081 length:411 start_codon:yes stop_codon:yes gene_type:complete